MYLFHILISIAGFATSCVASDGFAWDSLEQQKQLSFKPCYNGYQCSRLDLPLDWSSPDSHSRISLAVIKLPARVNITDPRYGGSIIVNPGGPGGSGVQHVLDNGHSIQQTVDATSDPLQDSRTVSADRYFDIVSFDPRGVGHTLPSMDCFSSDYANAVWEAQMNAEGVLGSSNVAFDMLWARSQARAKSCSRSKSPIISHMHTAAACHDIRELLVKLEDNCPAQFEGPIHHLQKSLASKPQPSLQYWGQSYGTILGMTFASLFPNQVHRMVLDGVSHGPDYYNGDRSHWQDDTDAVVEKFFEYCFSRGPEGCAFYRGTTWQNIASGLEELLDTLKVNPVIVDPPHPNGPDIITHADVVKLVREAAYSPEPTFDKLAILLNDVEKHNGALFLPHKLAADNLCTTHGSRFNATWPCPRNFEDHVATGVRCSDRPDQSHITKEAFRQMAKVTLSKSRWIGPSMIIGDMACFAWQTRGAGRFSGDVGGNTAHPILLISPVLDPATPLKSAHAMSRLFPGSVVLEQNSIGHCSTSVSSECTVAKIRKYFQTGRLPEKQTVCQPDNERFVAWPSYNQGRAV